MRIHTKLLINIFLPIAITLFVLLIMAIAMSRRNEADRKNAAALSLLSEMSQLNQRTYYYLLYHEERAKNEWFSIHDSLAALTYHLRFEDPLPDAVVERIRHNLHSMRQIFAERIVADSDGVPGVDPSLLRERQDRLSSQILIRARSITSDTYYIYNMITAEARKTDSSANTLILLVLLLSVLVTLSTLLPMNRKLSGLISQLTTGASIIGGGNLDHKIGIDTTDEIGQVARAFDAMTGNLKTSIVSRDELAAEVARRRRVEEDLRSSEAILKQAGQIAKLGAWKVDIVNHEDLDGNPLQWSEEVYRIFGYEPGGVDVTGKLFFERVHPDDRAGVVRAMAAAVESRSPFSIEHRIVLPDGAERVVLEHGEIAESAQTGPLRLIGAVQDITERKQAELALEHSRLEQERYAAQLETIFDNMTDGLVVADLKGNLFHWNPAALAMHGFGGVDEAHRHLEEFTNIFELSSGEDGVLPLDRWPLARVLRGDTIQHWEVHIRRRQSEWHRIFSYGGTLARDSEGKPLLAVIIVSDITERQQREEEFKKVSRQNQLILEFAGEGIFGLDLMGKVTFVNSRAAHLLGYHRDELLGTHSHTTWHSRRPDGSPYPGNECPIYAAYNEGTIRSGEEFFWRKDGTGFFVDFTSRPLYEEGDIAGAVVVYRDITERKRAEERLRESEERFRVTYEQAAVGIEIVSLDGRFLRGNGKLGALLGYSEEELAHLTSAALTHPDDLERELPLLRDLLEGSIPSYSLEKRYLKKHGAESWVRVTSSLARTASPYRIEIIEDITERKRSEEQLKKTVDELERSNKELEQFAYVASHDLQEPLRMVSSYVQMLERKYHDRLDDKANRYIFFAVDGVLRMQRLIDGLLAYSRVSRGASFTNVDMNRAYSQATMNLSLSIRESGATVTRDDLPAVLGDETQLIQVFQNLISNGIKFARVGEKPRVHVAVRRSREEWVFSVTDNGIGIDPRYAGRIFLIFQRLHSREEYPGTGIGLTLCKRIVERHNGRIWMESEPGRGSTFFFSLPLNKTEHAKTNNRKNGKKAG